MHHLEPLAYRPDIEPDRQHLAAQIDAASRKGWANRQDRPVRSMSFGSASHALDGLPEPRILPLGWNAHRLTQVGWSNEENVQVPDGCDALYILNRLRILDLNSDETIG